MAPIGHTAELEEAFRQARSLTRVHAKSFYFASHVLPKAKRDASYAVYEFCRVADNAVDTATPGAPSSAILLDTLRSDLDDVYASTSRRWLALADTVRRSSIPREYFDDLLRGVEMDLAPIRFETFDELKEYCYCVASVVGLMMARVFGVSDERSYARASDLGTAMQLTNILRDIDEDLSRGRVYLPREVLRRHGCTEESLARRTVDERFVSMMKAEIVRAREFYVRGEKGIPSLTDDGSRFCVQLMAGTYKRILDAIEANGYNVFSKRAHVPLRTKLAIAAGAYFSSRHQQAVST
jgi:15-cis-phytoene synthase